MSYQDYIDGQATANAVKYDSDRFYGLIQGAMRLADTDNLEMLKRCWPRVWADLQARYNAPGGKLAGER